jgi:integrase
MNLKVKPAVRLTCDFCGNDFYPAPQVLEPKTCGHPSCLKDYKRSVRARKTVGAFPAHLYHQVLDRTWKRKMWKEWFLIYTLGETGILISELCHIRPVDLFLDGADMRISIGPDFQSISGTVAGTIERWIRDNEIGRLDRIFPYTKRAAQKMFRRALGAADITGSWGTRSLRHMYGLFVAMATDSDKAVAKALRQKDVCSAKIYVRIARELILKGA